MASAQPFPDLFTPASATPAWKRNSWRVAVALIAVVVLVTAVVATQAFGQGDDFRVATVATRDVDSQQNGVATIEPVAQATVAFPVSGTVASVAVAIGDTVTAGQTLASLDTQDLTQALHSKQAALAQAQLALTKALSGEATSSPTSGGSGATLRSARTTGTSGIILTAATTDPSDANLAAAQQAVLNAQHDVDTALNTATSALNAAVTVCANVGTQSPTSADDLTACQTAIKTVLDAQTAVSTAQTALSNASTALDDLLAKRLAAVPATPETPTTPTTSPSDATPASGTGPATVEPSTGALGAPSSASGGTGGLGQTAASSPSAADLVSYQAAVDAAASAVTAAEQALGQATIASPIDGTIVAVNLANGESVTAASSTANVIVEGAGGYEVTTTVSVDDVSSVAVGQHATIVPDGSHKTLTGTVASISVVPDASNTTSTSYLVVIGLSDPKANLKNGSTGSVSIVTESARSALAVPTSAITTNGNRHTVEVLDGGSTKRVTVQVGVVGDTWTEIKSGLTEGQHVVLADLAEALPDSATSSSNSSQQNQRGGPPAGFPTIGVPR
jgi:HlyD family secretion protein